MKRVATIAGPESPVCREMTDLLNHGNRYRIGAVPGELAEADEAALLDALRQENVEVLVIENCSRTFSPEFPIPVMRIEPGESTADAIRRLATLCPDFTAERQWAKALDVEFDESRATPPPAPEEMPEDPQPVPLLAGTETGTADAQPERREIPRSYLLWAVLATIFFSMIPGIVAIVFSTSVSSRYWGGDYEGACRASRNVEIWVIVSIVVGVITNTLYLPVMIMSSLLG